MSQAKARLLVIDDEPDLRTLYELTLLRDGYDVETAACVDDARLTLAEQVFDAVITDMRLPDGTGLDVLRQLDSQGRRERTIVITAYGSAENAVEALKAGAYDYLTKPVDLKQFRAVVAAALAATTAPSPGLKDLSALKRADAKAAALEDSGHAAARPGSPSVPPAMPQGPATASLKDQSPASDAPVPAVAALTRLVGQSRAIRDVRSLIEKVARSMAPVLLWGESGTGKELVARAIHDVGVRHGQPFIAVNCGAIPEHLLEAEFFGYRKGAFTGAQDDREGFFQAAQGGTLFLDEIGDLPVSMQSKLLRAIQERAVRPLGAIAEIPLDVRILSATHKDLATEVQAGRFRQDLYYRLNVIQIALPALRDRLDDLPMICEQLLRRMSLESRSPYIPALGGSALAALERYRFPGNVRELENLLHRAVALSAGHTIEAEDLGLPLPDDFASPPSARAPEPAAWRAPAAATSTTAPVAAPALTTLPPPSPASDTSSQPAATAALPSDLAAYLDQIERDILVRALDKHRLNRTAAGASLGLSLRQMRYRMARLGVHVTARGVELGDRFDPDAGDTELDSLA
ncbi:MAG: sigma-54-dependent Fis family transcriptional regulator [Rubrivivax sp.]|nr:MAG: sigma-54-dependent Fis family transcriptional regulator [Rubrivivax sp.]